MKFNVAETAANWEDAGEGNLAETADEGEFAGERQCS